MEENEKIGGQDNEAGKNAGATPSLLALAKDFSRSTRFAIPRAVFMLMIFCFTSAFFSSLMTGLALSASSALAGTSGGARLSALAFLLVEFFSLAFILVLHYGLFLCNLRFVRNQPVAINFLFAGLRQRKARRGAAFLIVPTLACMALFAVITSQVEFFALPQIDTPDALLEFVKNNPDSVKKFLSCFVLFLFLAFVLYFPFTFVWSFVYDKARQNFWRSLLEGLKFFGKRPFNFFAFEFVCHFRKFFWIAALDALRVFIYKKNTDSAMLLSFGSLASFASFALAFYTAASVILSIQYYYNKFCDENSNAPSSN